MFAKDDKKTQKSLDATLDATVYPHVFCFTKNSEF